ncbi:MAG: SO_0444 family Cu/Zn efflux transporter [Candidatus Omnitrophica bacterium]|nr:SO_0444 family Cu/Zn efflux transporter [Candidatus Omnitrophota bacterium]MCA9428956.1 SO_0444 family Cu/Zn efflux transporter [Candidatus Omnitrophota bacterium]MCA9445807.1 SO_0444 family Cu/Zn efflux transporter [Candidatus Omnitrophota bacterium]
MDYINGFFEHLWILSVDAAPYLLVGFGIAALLHLYLPTHLLLRLLGEGRFRPTLTAALIGIPLPLCSCSVVPTAVAVREKGASPGATLSFFISTPETGVDSILLTYGMMGPIGPVMAVARPLAAGLSALSAGIFLDFFGGSLEKNPMRKGEMEVDKTASACSSNQPCCGQEASEGDCCSTPDSRGAKDASKLRRFLTAFRDSFLMLFDEIAFLVAIGLIFSAFLASLLPDDLGLSGALGSPFVEMGLAILIGLPMYVCATASTPLAAVLIAKGLSPGAALVFLLVGPATNIGTIALVRKFLGNLAIMAYLVSIVAISVLFGLVVNALCQDVALDFSEISPAFEGGPGVWGCAIFLWILLIWRASGRFSFLGRQKT